jgi:hypothetical protein
MLSYLSTTKKNFIQRKKYIFLVCTIYIWKQKIINVKAVFSILNVFILSIT